MEEPEMQLKVKKVTDKFTESMYVLANEPSVALYRLQEHVRRSLPELAQHKCHQEHERQQRLFQEHRGSAQAHHCHERPPERCPQVAPGSPPQTLLPPPEESQGLVGARGQDSSSVHCVDCG
uniref:Protein MEF2BNB n=1 Tax=Podarcis muralis TaxID=64176 RepID=A0A670K9H9_PODMU